MKKHHITVWDYTNVITGGNIPVTDALKHEVTALCVGGEDGILAFFYIDNLFCMASGDDGHWKLMYRCHKNWQTQIKNVVKQIPSIHINHSIIFPNNDNK